MTASCPRAPSSATDIEVELNELAAGTHLVRFHSPHFSGTSFNPNLGKRMEQAADGARFSPFPDVAGTNVPTLYAGTTDFAAALESVFHEVKHRPNPDYPSSKLKHFVVSRFSAMRPIRILELLNYQLRQVTVDGRDESLTEGELIQTPASQYPETRSWARHFHQSLSTLEGLAWRPRLGGEGLAYVFFGDRVASGDFVLTESLVPIHVGSMRSKIDAIATTAHITIIDTI